MATRENISNSSLQCDANSKQLFSSQVKQNLETFAQAGTTILCNN
jgi:hypothetical protein